MLVVLAAHLVAALVVGFAGKALGPRVFLVAAIAPAGSFVWLVTQRSLVLDGGTVAETLAWVPQLGLTVDLRLDAFSFLMALLVTGIGTLVMVYAASYFDHRTDIGKIAATLLVFAASMLGLVFADNLLLLYGFWELTSVTSFILIGIDDHKAAARAVALQAVLVTGAGALAMLAGFVLLGQTAGSYTLSAIVAEPPSSTPVAVALALILVGAFTKSAQFPFHFWLPAAMAAPTPISAYLHSATMVKAGVYLIARLAPAFAPLFVFWRPTVVGVGVVTMVVGGYGALRKHDLKSLLAYGTVSQLGFLVTLFGVGSPAFALAGVVLLLAHAIFKAALFLITGIIDHQAHSRDIRALSGLGRQMPLLFAVAAIATASMVGIPPLIGFLAKESALTASLGWGGTAGALVTIGIVGGSVLTVAYSARFLWGAFATEPAPGSPPAAAPPRPSWWFVLPPAVLAAASVLAGVLPVLTSDLLIPAAGALGVDTAGLSLSLWHGFNGPLGLSALILSGGGLLFAGRTQVERAQRAGGSPTKAADAYQATVRLLNHIADRVTGVVQNGSLPIYVGVILLTLVALPGSQLIGLLPTMGRAELAESPLQLLVGSLVVVATVATVRSRRRFVAALTLGSVGFGVAALFVIQGAPDLALTQLLIETLVVVIFLVVMRHLPDHFDVVPWRWGTAVRVLVSALVGVFVTVFAAVAAASRSAPPISSEMVERSVPDAGGRNIVNVILVDFRGFDTLGEITVLTVAALGIIALVSAGRRVISSTDDEHPDGAAGLETPPRTSPRADNPRPTEDT